MIIGSGSSATVVRWGVRIAGAVALLIGGFWLAAWLAGFGARWSAAGMITVKTNMSLALLLAGASLLLLGTDKPALPRRAVGALAAVLVLLIGSLTLSEHVFHYDLGIDQLLATEAPGAPATASPNRMGPPGSTCHTLLGIGLLVLAWAGRARVIVPYLGLAVCLIVLVPLVGFLYGVDEFYGSRVMHIAWPTVIALLGLGAGLMLAQSESGPMGLLLRQDSGGRLLRNMLPVAMLLPLVLGFLHVLGERWGLYGPATGSGLLAIALALVLSGMLWRSAAHLGRAAGMQRQAEDRQNYLASFPEQNPNPIVETSLDGDIRYLNPAAERLLPGLREQGLAHPWLAGWQAVVGRFREDSTVAVARAMAVGDRTYHQAFYCSATDGFVRIYGLDITERNVAEEAMRSGLQRFALLADVAGELLQTREPQKLVESLCSKVMEQLDCHAFFNFLVDEQAGKLHLNACAGIPAEEARRIEWLEYGAAVCGCAARDGCRIVAEHIRTTSDPRTELVKSYGIKAYACHPLLAPGGEAIGMLSFGTRSRETFSQDDLSLMKAVSDQVAVAMVRMRDEERLKQWSQTLKQRVAERTAEVENERQRFNSVLDILPAYVVLLTPDYHVPFANRFFEERFGKSNGRRCYEYLFNRAEPCENCETCKPLKTHAPHHWEWTGPDGRIYDIHDFPFTDSDGSPLIMEMGIDITERKRAEAALKQLNETLEQRVAEQTASLRASEQRVRQKLESVLSPEGDTGSMELADIIDAEAIQLLMDDFYKLARVPMTIMDLKGRILVGVGWQEICTKFHRVHPETCRHCAESDSQLSAGLSPGECKLYKCKNNLWDIATPVLIGGKHVGNLFSGQFFFEGETLDYDLFRAQAKQCGFDEREYLAALEAVPRLSRQTVSTGMDFFMKLAHMLSQLSYGNIKLARSLAQRDALMQSLQASEQQLQQINQTLEHRVAERTAEAEQRAVQLRALAAELTQAEQRERKRIAHILHDHFQQLLVGAKFDLSIIGSTCRDPQVPPDLERVSQVLSEAIEASRSLAIELSPPVLHDAGLTGGLVWLGRWMHEKHRLPVDVRVEAGAEPGDENTRIVLFHAVQELLLNVVKHAKAAAAQVTVARTNGRLVRIEVCDDGVGFDPHAPGHNGNGSGFGLFSIRERLRVMGGGLVIDSCGGQGTRVVLSAPLSVEPAHDPDGPVPHRGGSPPTAGQPQNGDDSVAAAGAASIRVMLADDHQVVRDGLSRLLQMQPDIAVVGQASDGLEAVDLALKTKPDVIVMDITMPGLTGIEATRCILGQLPGVRIIGLSMHAENDMAQAMQQAGAVAYLSKASGPHALIDAIRTAAGCVCPDGA